MMKELADEVQKLWTEIYDYLVAPGNGKLKALRDQMQRKMGQLHALIVSSQKANAHDADDESPPGNSPA